MSSTEVAAAVEVEQLVEVGDGMRLCYRAAGDPADPALLLIAGLGQQLNVWPAALVEGLVERGLYVVRFDNRDVGRSDRVDSPTPGAAQFLRRRFAPSQYTLAEMCADTVGLLDALAIERAHLVGMSMGGMIAQALAAREPDRVLSLTSIMSTTGVARLGRPAPSTWVRLALPAPRTRQATAKRVVGMMRHVGSRGYPFDEAAVRAMALEGWDRSGGSGAPGVGPAAGGDLQVRRPHPRTGADQGADARHPRRPRPDGRPERRPRHRRRDPRRPPAGDDRHGPRPARRRLSQLVEEIAAQAERAAGAPA